MGKEQGAERIEWVDTAKFICIMSVMVSHLESNTTFLSTFYFPFYLMMFFFASGYVYRYKSNVRSFMLHKIRGLLIPWFVFSIFNILLSQILSFNQHESLRHELLWNFMQIRGLGDEVWFVAALFVAYFPFYYLINKYEKIPCREAEVKLLLTTSALYVCSVLYTKKMDPQLLPWGSVALPWHIEYIPQALLFMILGYLFRK